MLQNFSIFNLFVVTDEVKNEIKQVVVNSLCDEQLEVRLSASIALTGFIHSNFIQVNEDLIVNFTAIYFRFDINN